MKILDNKPRLSTLLCRDVNKNRNNRQTSTQLRKNVLIRNAATVLDTTLRHAIKNMVGGL